MSDDIDLCRSGSKCERRLDETRDKILKAMQDYFAPDDSEDDWLIDLDTVFDRLAYLYEVAGGSRKDLVLRWPDFFDLEFGRA